MGLEMLGQLDDAPGQDGDLHLGGAGVGLGAGASEMIFALSSLSNAMREIPFLPVDACPKGPAGQAAPC